MKERPILFSGPLVRAILDGRKSQTRRLIRSAGLGEKLAEMKPLSLAMNSPYGGPGDRLWVRETFAGPVLSVRGDDFVEDYYWRASDEQPRDYKGKLVRWRPSIHMPRAASRITLEVTSVRVERLQAITEEDAVAEGVDAIPVGDVPRQATWSRRQDFAQLWDKINGKRATWASNPWVFVIAFRRLAP